MAEQAAPAPEDRRKNRMAFAASASNVERIFQRSAENRRDVFAEAAYFIGMLLPARSMAMIKGANYFGREIDISL